jgi:adenine deaminase
MKISGNIVDVVAGRVFRGSIDMRDGIIFRVQEEECEGDNFIIPGFVDAHVHVESSMLVPSQFGRLALSHGTVATVSDPHEIANVLGMEGVHYMIDDAKRTPLKIYFGAPSCVPATRFETAGAELGVDDVRSLLEMPGIHYLAEMMNFPGVLNHDPEVMAKIRVAHELGKVVDGHAPGLRDEAAIRYINAGISTDHECVEYEEARHKALHGMKILIREGSAAKNFEALYPLVDEFPDKVMFCTDDSHPNSLIKGHINRIVARAVRKGCEPMNVLRAATLNPVKHYSLKVGLLQAGDSADCCIVNNLEDFEVLQTYIDGRSVFERGMAIEEIAPAPIINHFNASRVNPENLRIPFAGSNLSARVRVIAVEDGQLITKEEIHDFIPVQNRLDSDVSRDILKLVVLNRYRPAEPAVALIRNFGLKKGALASCVAHDSHNIIAVGTNDEDLACAINRIVENKGGLAMVAGNEMYDIPLPVAGIMTNADAFETAKKYEALLVKCKEWGVHLYDPFMTLSFCALLVIPEIKLSDLGLFDGKKFEFIPLVHQSI